MEQRETPTCLADRGLRRQIDRSVSRALADDDFARRLLTNPALAVSGHGCSPHQLRSLLNIQATDLTDFARQAHAQFWPVETDRAPQAEELLAAATRR